MRPRRMSFPTQTIDRESNPPLRSANTGMSIQPSFNAVPEAFSEGVLDLGRTGPPLRCRPWEPVTFDYRTTGGSHQSVSGGQPLDLCPKGLGDRRVLPKKVLHDEPLVDGNGRSRDLHDQFDLGRNDQPTRKCAIEQRLNPRKSLNATSCWFFQSPSDAREVTFQVRWDFVTPACRCARSSNTLSLRSGPASSAERREPSDYRAGSPRPRQSLEPSPPAAVCRPVASDRLAIATCRTRHLASSRPESCPAT